MKKRIIKNRFVDNDEIVKVNNSNSSQVKDPKENEKESNENNNSSQNNSDLNKDRYDFIIKDAKKQAESIISNANKKGEEIFEQQEKEGYNKGHNAGYKEALKEVEKEKEKILKEVKIIKENTQQKYEDILRSSEAEIVKMIMEISKKLLYDDLHKNKDIILNIVQKTIEKSTNRKKIHLKVSPDDFNAVTNNRDILISKIDGLETLEIEHDDNITSGSCKIESTNGIINSDIEKRLKGIEDSFYDLVESNKEV